MIKFNKRVFTRCVLIRNVMVIEMPLKHGASKVLNTCSGEEDNPRFYSIRKCQKAFKTNVYTDTFNKVSVDQFSMFSPSPSKNSIRARPQDKSI